ncbi:MAG: HAD family phosphatase [Bacteroidota bacterium]
MRSDYVVLFDLGNVLVQIHPEAFAATLGVSENESRGYRPLVIKTTQRYERGELTTDEFFADLSGIFDGRYGRLHLEEAMQNVIGKPIPGMAELLEKTSFAAEIALVSNTNETHFEFCRKSFPFLSFIPRYFLSWEMKVLKPDVEYYARVLRELNLPAQRAVFIDDLPENINGAVNAGMIGIVFKGVGDLTEKLKGLKVF